MKCIFSCYNRAKTGYKYYSTVVGEITTTLVIIITIIIATIIIIITTIVITTTIIMTIVIIMIKTQVRDILTTSTVGKCSERCQEEDFCNRCIILIIAIIAIILLINI